MNSGKSTVFFVEFVSKYNISKGFIPAVSRSSGSTKVYSTPKFLQTLIILSILSLSGDTYVIPKFFALPWLVILVT